MLFLIWDKCNEFTFSHLLPVHSPTQLYKPPVTKVVYAISQQTTSVQVPTVSAVLNQSPTNSPSTVSKRSDDLLLPPSPPAQARSPNYAQLNVKQTQVPPLANDDHVQYAQIEHQDTMWQLTTAASLLACHCSYHLFTNWCFNLFNFNVWLLHLISFYFMQLLCMWCVQKLSLYRELYIQIRGPKSVAPMVSRLL